MRNIDSTEFVEGKTRAEVEAKWKLKYPDPPAFGEVLAIRVDLFGENVEEDSEIKKARSRAFEARKEDRNLVLKNAENETTGALLYFALMTQYTAAKQASDELGRRGVVW